MKSTFFDDLSRSSSPYLRGHAPSRVKWNTWSLKPLQEAASSGKPLFISIGFASSYMCTKMNKECFLDEEVAKKLNENFVCIKIDKDESSLIHHYLLNFAKILIPHDLTWPVNLFLTPDLKPFFGVSYLPKSSTHDEGGMLEILEEVIMLYKEDMSTVEAQGNKMISFYNTDIVPAMPVSQEPMKHEELAARLFAIVDPLHAGIKSVCKLPLSYQTHFLLQYGQQHQDLRAFFFIGETFKKMRLSNISDKLYGGYFSFTHDEAWEKPYFEKSLTINTMIGDALLTFAKKASDEESLKEAEKVVNFILANLKIKDEGFGLTEYSLEEERLGDSYKLSTEYIHELLEGEDLDIFLSYFTIAFAGTSGGANILSCKNSIAQWAEEAGEDEESILLSLNRSLDKLRKGMKNEKPATLDTRQFLGANAQTALLLYKAGKLLNNESYLIYCYDLLEFLHKNFQTKEYFYQYYDEKKAHNAAELEDLVAYLHTLLILFNKTEKGEYKERADQVIRIIDNHFYQGKNGLFFSKSTPLSLEVPIFFEDLIAPSAQAIHAHNLLLISRIYDNQSYFDQGSKLIECLKERAYDNPWSYTYLLYVELLHNN